MKRPPGMFVPKGTKNFAYRKVIPVELREFFKDQTSFNETLGTDVYADALQVYYRVAAKYEAELENARQGRPTGSIYDTEKRKRFRQSQLSKKNIFTYTDKTDGGEWFDPELMTREEAVIYQENALAEQRIAKLEQAKITGAVDVRLADIEIEALRHLIRGTIPIGEPESSTLPYLAKVAGEYFEEIAPTLKKVTLNKKRTHIALFIKWVKSKPIDQYTLKDGNDFLARLKKLPAKGKAKGTLLKPNSINAYLINVSQLFDWLAGRHGDTVVNPTKTIRLIERTPTIAAKPRTSFSTDELNRIFAALTPSHRLYWAVLIPLYSSIRVQACCQLRKRDIKKRGGVWFFDIHMRGDNRLKNAQAEREIPVHDRLIELGLLEFVKKTDDYLFPYAAKGPRGYKNSGTDRWADRLGTVFRRFLQNEDLKRPELSFNSLRHCFVDECREGAVDFVAGLWLQGRREPGSGATYGDWKKLERRQTELNKIKYDFVMPTGQTVKT